MPHSARHHGVPSSSKPDSVLLRRPGLTPGVASAVFSPATVTITVGGVAAFYSVELCCSHAPEQPVTVAPVNLPTGLRVFPALHVFTAENWSEPQFFRLAALNGGVFEELRGGGAAIEHTTSSLDPRFHGRRVLQVPTAVQAQICPREGSCLFATGKAEATLSKQQSQLNSKLPTTTHEFTEVELRRGMQAARPLVARCSILVPMAAGALAAVAAVEAANVAAAQAAEVQSRRRLSAEAIVPHAEASVDTEEPATATRAAIDLNNTLVKLTSHGNRTLALYHDGEVVALGSSEPSSTTAYSRRESGADAALSRMLLDVACGDAHMAAASEQGYLLTWGDVRGRCGAKAPSNKDATTVSSPRIVQPLLHKRIVQVACGAAHSFALAEDGDVFSWGLGHSGALGHGLNVYEQTFEAVASPMEVLSLKGRRVVQIACGDTHSAALLASGDLLTCGQYEHGRLGRQVHRGRRPRDSNERENSSWFAPVAFPQTGTRCTFVACGTAHTLAVCGPHELFAFGWNASGQLGVGDCRDRYVPVRVAYFDRISLPRGAALPPLGIASIAAGKLHSLACSPDGRLFAWGNDEMGQCGLSACPQIYTLPHLVTSLVGLRVTQLAAGEAHSAVLTSLAQRHLETLERTQPTQYAQLVEHYERAVNDDARRRSYVLEHARRHQLERATAARRRKPRTDPATIALAKILQLQTLVDQDATLDQRRLQKRPQTARAVVSRNAEMVSEIQSSEKRHSQSVRCCSASMVRRARLAVLQAPLSEFTEIPKSQGPSASNTFKPRAVSPSYPRRPKSAAAVRPPSRSKTTSEGHRQLAATLHYRNAPHTPEASVVGIFPPSRPKSAPCRPPVRRETSG